MNHLDPILTTIAREKLNISTLEIRRSDRLDFHDVAVWQVEAALKAAFDAGSRTAGIIVKPHEEFAPVGLATPLLVPKGTPLVSGKMYLRLYHGRTDPALEMEEWGFDGPTFGPLSCYVHTYCCTFRIHSECGSTELWLDKHGDMILWDAFFYGDLEVFIAATNDKA